MQQSGHNKVGGHWVEIALHTFHGSVERLQEKPNSAFPE